jgi:hypothetical protein
MPLDRARPLAPAPATVAASQYDQPDPSYLDTLGAWLRQENIIGSALASPRLGVADFHRVDRNHKLDLTGYEDFADSFDDVYNPQAEAAVKASVDNEIRDRKTMAASGWVASGLGMGAAFLNDPTILLPGGALVKAGSLGYRAGRTALGVGAAAGIGTGVQEAGLQATQEVRPGMETALAIGGSVLLGGLVGAAGAKFFSKQEWGRFSKALKDDLSADVPNPDDLVNTIVTRAQSAGAASVDNLKLDDLGVGGPRIAQAVANATAAARINPGVQTMLSPSLKVRETYAQMVDNPIYSRMNMEGQTLGPDVENLVKQYQRGSLAQWLKSSRQAYREARKDGSWKGTRSEFYEAVAKAARRGDVDPGGNIHVTKAAQDARAQIMDPLAKGAMDAKILDPDVKTTTAASYLHRMWNRTRLVAEEERFRQIARDYFAKELAKIPANKRGVDFVSKADMDDYIEDVVTSVYNNLTGKGAGDVPAWLVPVKRGPLKERTFRIADELVEDFLENDMELIMRRYTRVMGAEVELAKKFGRADMKEQIDAIRKEYTDLRKQAKTDDARDKLNRAEARDIKNLEAFRDLIRGTYRAAEEGSEWSKLTRAALAWNYTRLLGGVVLTSVTDASRLIGVHGVRATMKEALPALVSNLKAARLSRQDARDLGVIAETVLQSRLASLADLHDPYAQGSKFDRFLSNTTNAFSKATGLSWWNDTMKTMASVMTQNRILRNAKNYSKADKRERAYMAFLGINEDMAQRIAVQFEKHGAEENGIFGANVSKWDDELARRAYGAALAKDVDRTIITKGVADTPLWMKTNWGRLIMQFKSFALASHQRTLIAGLQERPQRLAEQMVFATAIGMMISYLKMIERGDTDRAEDLISNPGKWVADGLDRTGILALPFDVTNTADKVVSSYGGPNIGINRIFSEIAGDENTGGGATRYASRNATGAIGGPTVGIFEDLANIASSLAKNDFNKGSANALIRQIPGATLPGIRTAIHVGIKPELHEAVD